MKNGLPSVSSCSVGDEGRRRARRRRARRRARRSRRASRPPSVDLLERPLAAEAGEQRGERLARPRRVAVGGHEQRALRRGRAHEVAEQLERRPVGPVQVVEHDEQRRVAGDLGQQRGDRVEQAQPLRVGLAAAQSAPTSGRAGGAQLRAGRARARRRAGRAAAASGASDGAAGPPAQHLHDRLVRRRRLLVEAAVEHDARRRAWACARELGREPRLADAGVAGEHDEPRGAAGRRAPRRLERGGLVRAADERVAGADAPSSGAGQRRPAGTAAAGRGRGRRARAAQHALVDRHRVRARASCRAPRAAARAGSSNARSASAGLPAASCASISSRCADSRNGAAAIAGARGSTASPSSRRAAARPAAQHLERADPDRLELGALLVQPGAVLSGSRSPAHASSAACAASAAAAQSPSCSARLGAARRAAAAASTSTQTGAARLEPQLGAPAQRVVAERAAQLGEERAERRVRARPAAPRARARRAARRAGRCARG